jgi:hypothetical protein
VEEIMENQDVREAFLSEQREALDREGGAEKLNRQTERTRFEHFERKSARVFYYLQKAFCDPQDYRETEAKNEARLLPFLIVDPDRVSDALLLQLGLFDPAETDENPNERQRRKIAAVREFKNLFEKIQPIKVSETSVSARISSISDPGKSWHGKLLSFQNLTDYALDSADREYRTRSVSVRLHPDAYSAVRSQKYAISEIEAKIAFLQSLQTQLNELLQRTSVLSEEEMRTYVANIREALSGKQTYYEIRALKNRLEKMEWTHKVRDSLRIRGAYNDLSKAVRGQIGKKRSLMEQEELFLLSIESEKKRIRQFLSDFFHAVAKMDQEEFETAAEALSNKVSPPPLTAKARSGFAYPLRIIRDFFSSVETDATKTEPFLSFYEKLKVAVAAFPSDQSDRALLRNFLSIVLLLKEAGIRFRAFEWEDSIKRNDTVPFPFEKMEERVRAAQKELGKPAFLRNCLKTSDAPEGEKILPSFGETRFEGDSPSAGSPTDTLLRLKPSQSPYHGPRYYPAGFQ